MRSAKEGMAVEPIGRLELTWTNKHLRLISDADGGYEWVDRRDPRVTEVRLLNEIAIVGDAASAEDNLLIEGDALYALTALNRIPELAEQYAGKVRLVYIDPPFNTGEAFEHYDDNLEHSVWLTMLRDRLQQIRPLLASNGSVWVHLDDNEVHRCRVVLDEIFGAKSMVASIVWQKKYSRDNRPAIGTVHDNILVYAPMGPRWKSERNRVPRVNASQYRNPNHDPRGPWRPIPLDVQGGHATTAQFYDVTTPSGRVVRPANGRAWSVTEPVMQAMIERGDVYFGRDGNGMPNTVRYLADDEGLVPWSWWPQDEVGNNDDAKKEIVALFGESSVFDTPKPERLLQRIIHIASDPGDIVMDCFVGSGTTAAVAHKMGRRWIAAELQGETIQRFTRPRLERVVNNDDPGGVTATQSPTGSGLPDGVRAGEARLAARVLDKYLRSGDLESVDDLDQSVLQSVIDFLRDSERMETEVVWQGGGGFRHLKVGPSMFDLDADTGDVYLAEWATNGAFSEAVAAQLGFTQLDEPPFCGLKGRTRLAVLDGVVGAAEIEFLVAALGERERLVVVGQAFTEDAESTLRQLSPGCRIRHAPQDLLRGGGQR